MGQKSTSSRHLPDPSLLTTWHDPSNHTGFSRPLNDALKQHLLHTRVVGTRKDVFLRGASSPMFGYLSAGPPEHSGGEGLLPSDSSPATRLLL